MKIKDVMAPNVRTCFMSNNLATAAQLMWDHDCGCVPVQTETRGWWECLPTETSAWQLTSRECR
jgi:hypothetical protein